MQGPVIPLQSSESDEDKLLCTNNINLSFCCGTRKTLGTESPAHN